MFDWKFDPVNVTVVSTDPASTATGETSVSDGTGVAGRLTVNVEVVLPPPGAGFVTVTVNEPLEARRVAGTVVVIPVDVSLPTVREVVPQVTVVEALKPVPVMVRAVAEAPAIAVFGDRDVTVGAGLLTVKVSLLLVCCAKTGIASVNSRTARASFFT